MEALAATYLLSMMTTLFALSRGASVLKANAHSFAQSINDTQSAEAKAHSNVVPIRREAA